MAIDSPSGQHADAGSTTHGPDFADCQVAGIIGADSTHETRRPTQSMQNDGDVEQRTAKVRPIGQLLLLESARG